MQKQQFTLNRAVIQTITPCLKKQAKLFMSMHYRVKRRCSKLSHDAVDLIVSIRLLTIASSIRQKAPHDLIIL